MVEVWFKTFKVSMRCTTDVTESVRNTDSMVMAGQINCFYVICFQLKKQKIMNDMKLLLIFLTASNNQKKLHVSTNQVKMGKQNQRGGRQKF